MTVDIYFGDNLPILQSFKDSIFDLIYIDPPFNTGKRQQRTSIETNQNDTGDRIGYGGKCYKTTVIDTKSFNDVFDDFIGFIEPRIVEAYRILSNTGSFFLHLDYREVHYCKVLCDQIFGRDHFINEIIWAYDYGGKSKTRWSPKHDNILWYVKDPTSYTFNYDLIDRVPYMSPSLVGPEKAAIGKVPTDCWWHTIVPTNSKEKTGYPTQKPVGVINRIVKVHSNVGDNLLDFFAGSGTLGYCAATLDRNVTLVDESETAIDVMVKRLSSFNPVVRKWNN